MFSSLFSPNRVKTTVAGITTILTTIGGILNTVSTIDEHGNRGHPDYVSSAAGLGGGLMLIFAYDPPKKPKKGSDQQDVQPPQA